jgi:hypothetical protein
VLGFVTTLLHLSAHLGFSQFATFLLDQPGASHALDIQDRNGKLPLDIANDKGLKLLADAFLRYVCMILQNKDHINCSSKNDPERRESL